MIYTILKYILSYSGIQQGMSKLYRIKSKSSSIRKPDAHHSPKRKLPPLKIGESSNYRCLLEAQNSQEQWRSVLEQQLDFSWAATAFQNSQGTFKVDPKKKLMLRETFLLKKSIINCITLQKFEDLVEKLQQLKKTSVQDSGLAKLSIYLLEIRSNLIEKSFKFSNDVIDKISLEILPSITKQEKQQQNTFYGKIIYILALHLIKLRGVLLEKNSVKLVVQALNIKKKIFCSMSLSAKKQAISSLLFLTFEFYKIVHLIKLDQDLSLIFYNQLKAYIKIWKTKLGGFDQFNKKLNIEANLKDKIPLRLNLKVYEDHDRRRVLSFQNVQNQLMKCQGEQNQDEEFQDFANSTNAIILDSKENKDIDQEKRLRIGNNRLKKTSTVVQSDFLQKQFEDNEVPLAKDHKDAFSFQFTFSENCKIYIGEFQIIFDESLRLFSMQVILKDSVQFIGTFKIQNIALEASEKAGTFAKKLWRIVKEIFYTDKSEFIPSLFSFQFPPIEHANSATLTEKQLPILVRIHSILLHFIRTQHFYRKVNGKVFQFPQITGHETAFLNNSFRNDQKIFIKRIGFISFNRKKEKKNQTTQSIRLIVLLKDGANSYLVFCAEYENKELKGIQIYQKQKKLKNQTIILSEKLKVLKKLAYNNGFPKKSQIVDLTNFIGAGQESQTRSNYQGYLKNDRQKKQGIEQQFEVIKSPTLQTQANTIKIYRCSQTHTFTVLQAEKKFQKALLKINGKYWVAQTCKQGKSFKYFDKKRELLLQKQYEHKYNIGYNKLRIHKAFQWVENGQVVKGYPSKKTEVNIEFLKRYQEITVRWVKTSLFRQGKAYYYLNLFQIQDVFVIELWDLSNQTCLLGIHPQIQLEPLPFSWRLDLRQMTLNTKVKLETFETTGKPLCTAQKYYQQKKQQQMISV